MRPSSRLPPHILASMIAVAAACLGILLARPGPALALLAVAVVATLAGAACVARAAARRRARPDPEGWVLLRHAGPASGTFAGDGTWVAGVFVAAGAVLAAFAAPGLYVKDAGELVAAVHGLGVAHPTGFAAYCLAGKGLDLLPVGGGAFRLNLLSVLSMAAASALAFLVASELARFAVPGPARVATRLAAVAAAVAVPASHLAWLHGTTTEVYAFSLAGMAAAIAAWTLGATRDDARWLAAGAFLTGLGLGGHVTWPLYAGIAGAASTVAFVVRRRAYGLPVLLALAALAGAAVVLYLPAAASREPYMNWGDPSDAAGTWAHLTGARIRSAFRDRLASVPWAMTWTHAVRSLRVLADGASAVAPAAVAGCVALVARRPAAGLVALGMVVADLGFSARVNPMGIVDLQTLLPATWFVAVLAGAGAAMAVRWLPRLAIPVAAAALALAGLQAVSSPADRDMARVRAPAAVIGDFLDRLPPGATVLASSDNLSSGLAGIQVLESPRPDVLPLVKQHLGDTAYVRARTAFHAGADDPLATAARDAPFEVGGESPAQAVSRAVELALRRGAVWMELGEGAVDRPLYPVLVPDFPAFAVRPGSAPDPGAAVAAVERAKARLADADRWTASWVAVYLRTAGAWAAARGDASLARLLTVEAVRVDPRDARGLFNLGVLLRAAGDTAGALDWFRQAVDADPSYVRAWDALARAAEASGDPALAAKAAARHRALGGEE